MNIKKKLAAVIMAAVTTCSVAAIPMSSNAAYNWRTGNFAGKNSYTSEHTYCVSKGTPTVNFYSYYANGKKSTGDTMQVKITNANTGYIIYNGKTVSSGGSLKLKGNATQYKIQIRRKSGNKNAANSTCWAMRTNAKNGWID